MASPSSSARLNALIRRGMSMGTTAFILFMMLPLSKSAPLAFCAAMMRFVSSISVGIKRRAMLIISASSCTGNLIHFKGVRRLSMPSVRRTGVVVSVSTAEAITRRNRRSSRNTVYTTASR